jgi:hypothetical protein
LEQREQEFLLQFRPTMYLNDDSNQDVVVGKAFNKPTDDKVIIEELQRRNIYGPI